MAGAITTPLTATVIFVRIGLNVSVITTLSVAVASVLPVFCKVNVYVSSLFSVTFIGQRDFVIESIGSFITEIISFAVIGVFSPSAVTVTTFVISLPETRGAKLLVVVS